MLFRDYFYLLKKYCKRKTADPDLCRDLFNSIIENTENDDVFVDYDKTVVSRILSGKRGLPNKVRDYVYDNSVNEGISEYFDNYIVPQLVPTHEDLMHEICMLLESYSNLSKPHLSVLKSLAKEKTLGVFLSEVFRYAIIEAESDEPQKQTTDSISIATSSQTAINKVPILTLSGISNDNNLDECFFIEQYSDRSDVSKSFYIKKLESLYEAVSQIHLPGPPITSDNSFFAFYETVTIDANDVKIIKKVADQLSIHLDEDFFNLGGLSKSFTTIYPSLYPSFGSDIPVEGTDTEKKKYHLINTIKSTIFDYSTALPFIIEFENVKTIRLAVRNTGTMHDENVRVSLEFEKGKILSIKQMSTLDQAVYDYIMQDSDKDNLFGIPRGKDFLDYGSSKKTFRPIPARGLSLTSGFFGNSYDTDDKEEELEDYLEYRVFQKGDKEYINVEIEEIMHNDAVAFPSMILLKSEIDSIPYSIHSKYMEHEISGILRIKG